MKDMQGTRLTRRYFSQHVWVGLVLPFLSHQWSFNKGVIGHVMHITLERSGGFTGMPLTITVDTATLSPDKASQLRRLVEAADVFHVPVSSLPAQPDRFAYELTIQDGDRTHTIAFEEAAIPEPLKPIMHWLMDISQQH